MPFALGSIKALNITTVKFLSKLLFKRRCVILGAMHIPWTILEMGGCPISE
jgi:hypothetical protein